MTDNDDRQSSVGESVSPRISQEFCQSSPFSAEIRYVDKNWFVLQTGLWCVQGFLEAER
jgi:hypothetical protein